VHASSAVRFQESYKSIAQRLQLNGWNEPKVEILGMVHDWLSNENNGRWTMVVDNADNTSVLFEPWSGETKLGTSAPAPASARYSLADYLPLSPNGSTVITTRNRKVAEGLIEHAEDILDVRPMETEEAVALLMKRLKKQESDLVRDDLVDLARELDCMPLAISQAAAYVNQRAPRVTVSKYLDELRQSDYGRAKLLQIDIRDPRRDGQASNSILTTWYMSFEYLRQKQDSAARLLSLMSLFDREGIPDYLLRDRYQKEPYSEHKKANKNQEAGKNNEIDLEDDITTLRAYNLIRVGVSEQLFDMHRLVQFSTKTWLEMHNELQSWQERYIDILGAAFPVGNYTNWVTCQALFPHVEALEVHRVRSTDHLQVWARVLYNGAWYAMERGQYGLAEKMARASLKVRQDDLGLNNTTTLDSISILASVLQHRGQYKQAEEMNQRALAGREKELGVNHPDTLMSVSNLASVLQYRGQYKQAEEMNRRVLAGREKELGVNHPLTLISMSNLASVLQYRGQYKQAEELNRRALVGREKELGVNHPDTLTSVSNLGLVLQYRGQYELAEEMNRRALAGREKELGVNHPLTLMSMSNLASVLQYQRQYEQAEEMNRRALAGREKELGVNHPDTLTSVSDLALVLQYRGQYEQAEEMNRRVLAGREKDLGMDHPLTLISVSNLALVLQYRGQYKQAEEMNRRALAGREKELGVDHFDTLTSVYCLAHLLGTSQDYHEALNLYQRAIVGYDKLLGPEHPTTVACQKHRALLVEKISLCQH
jgi:tetratricopeptide (TPR) repeat protein